MVHKLRDLPSFVPELDFVAEAEGRIVGHIIYSIAKVRMPDNQEIEVLNFGPLSVHPDYKRMGVGSALMRHSIARQQDWDIAQLFSMDIPIITRDLGFGEQAGMVSYPLAVAAGTR